MEDNIFTDIFNMYSKFAMFSFGSFIIVVTIVIIVVLVSSKKKKTINTDEKLNNIKIKYNDIINKIYDMITTDEELNKYRHEFFKYSRIGIIFTIGGILLSFFAGLGIPLIVVGVIFLLKIGKNSYDDIYKEKIVKFALKEYDDKLEYYPNGCITEEQYQIANFGRYDRYHSEDRIDGTILGYNFIMADVHTEDRREDSDGDTTYVTLFKGQVAIVELSKTVEFELEIKSNSIKLFNKKKIVEIDNPEFEEIYDVYTSDQVKAMTILTPAVTNRMLDLYNKYGFIFEFKFVRNYMYFRFDSGNLFVPYAKSPMDEAIGVAWYFEIIEGIKDIMKEVIEATESVRK